MAKGTLFKLDISVGHKCLHNTFMTIKYLWILSLFPISIQFYYYYKLYFIDVHIWRLLLGIRSLRVIRACNIDYVILVCINGEIRIISTPNISLDFITQLLIFSLDYRQIVSRPSFQARRKNQQRFPPTFYISEKYSRFPYQQLPLGGFAFVLQTHLYLL